MFNCYLHKCNLTISNEHTTRKDMSKLIISMDFNKLEKLEADYIQRFSKEEEKKYYTLTQLIDENPFPEVPTIEVFDIEKMSLYRIESIDNFTDWSLHLIDFVTGKTKEVSHTVEQADHVYNLFRIVFLAIRDKDVKLYESDRANIEYLEKRNDGKKVKRSYSIKYRTIWLDTKCSSIERFKRSAGIKAELTHSFPRIGHWRIHDGIGKSHTGERTVIGKTWVNATWVRDDLERNEKHVIRIK